MFLKVLDLNISRFNLSAETVVIRKNLGFRDKFNFIVDKFDGEKESEVRADLTLHPSKFQN